MLTPKGIATVAAAVCSMTGVVSAKEVPVNMKLKAELYDSGIRHEQIMALKNVSPQSSFPHYSSN